MNGHDSRRLAEACEHGATGRRPRLRAAVLACGVLLAVTTASTGGKFERTYAPKGNAYLTISNVNGDVRVRAWDRRTISVRANAGPSVNISDRVDGDHITVAVKSNARAARADFEISIPPATALELKNIMGEIEIVGAAGHCRAESFEGNVHLSAFRGPSADVKVTTGSIFFEGELRDGGNYSLQSFNGDIDVTIPASASFNLTARSLSEHINLGDFLNSMRATNRRAKDFTGTHRDGGPRLILTTYRGRILMHRK